MRVDQFVKNKRMVDLHTPNDVDPWALANEVAEEENYDIKSWEELKQWIENPYSE